MSIREKKLAVMWLADRAVVNYLIKDCSDGIKLSVQQKQLMFTESLKKDFTESELLEIQELDNQIPKT